MKVPQSMQCARAIIVVDDDTDGQELLAETFGSLNYPHPIIFFSDGHDALNYLQQTRVPPALIISDINMPKLNGFEIRKRINKSPEITKARYTICIPKYNFEKRASYR